jgi:hypothetical protein
VPRITTVGQIQVNKSLPENLRDYERVLDAKGLSQLLSRLAIENPDSYRETTKKLMDISRVAATRTGGFSFDLTHMRRNKAATKYRDQLQQQMHVILGDDSLDDAERNKRLIDAARKVQQMQPEEIFQEELAKKNPLAYQVLSGARGNKRNLASLISGDMLYEDSKGNTIPVPILESFAEGSSAASYLASVFGARKSVIDTKLRTADAGYFGKQLNQIAHRTLVAAEDEDDERDPDDDTPRYTRGMPTDIDDQDNEGALLAQSVGGYERNTVLTPKIIRAIKQKGIKRLLVRSVVANGLADGSVYSRDVGVFENGRLPTVGTMIGNPSAQATSEPVSQGSLGSKHGGGVAGATKAVSGFEALNALIQAPKIYPHGAAHSEEDGAVQRISDAPAGGKFVYINDKEHYVPPGKELLIKPGDTVEAGDVLSEGVPHPATVTKYKGVGEGQRYWAHAMRDSMKASGLATNRRNLEVLANSLIGHVQLDDEIDGWAPDEIVPYRLIANNYRPRQGSEELEINRALGQHLEAPVLHYSIGTKVRPSVLKNLQEFGIPRVTVHRDPPPFQPRMVRAADNLQYDEDWMTRMYGSGLKSSLLDAVHAGSTADEQGSSFVPALAHGAGFGTYGKFISRPQPSRPIAATPSPFAANFATGDKIASVEATRLYETKAAGDVNATPNKSITNTAPAGGTVSGGADRAGDYSTGGALSSLAQSDGPAAGGSGTSSGLSLGAPPPVTNFNRPDYVPPSSNGGAARPGQTSNTTPVGPAEPQQPPGPAYLAGSIASSVVPQSLATHYGQKALQPKLTPRAPAALTPRVRLTGAAAGAAGSLAFDALTGQPITAGSAAETLATTGIAAVGSGLSGNIGAAALVDAGKNLTGLVSQQDIADRAAQLEQADALQRSGQLGLKGDLLNTAGTILAPVTATRAAMKIKGDFDNTVQQANQGTQQAQSYYADKTQKALAAPASEEAFASVFQNQKANADMELAAFRQSLIKGARPGDYSKIEQVVGEKMQQRAEIRSQLQLAASGQVPLSQADEAKLRFQLIDLNKTIRGAEQSLTNPSFFGGPALDRGLLQPGKDEASYASDYARAPQQLSLDQFHAYNSLRGLHQQRSKLQQQLAAAANDYGTQQKLVAQRQALDNQIAQARLAVRS